MDVPSDFINKTLDIYFPSAADVSSLHYLQSASFNNQSVSGNFSIPHSFYLRSDVSTNHLNLIDLMLCTNQLAFVGIGYGLKTNAFAGFDASMYQYFEEKRCDCVITSFGKVTFRKPTNPHFFQGTLSFDRVKCIDNVVFVKTTAKYECVDAIPITLCLKKTGYS